MAQLDASLILAGRPLDVVGAMRQGNAAAMETNQIRQQNALAQVYQTQGQGLMQGNPQSLNALAPIDPVQAQGFYQGAQTMRINEEELRLKYDEAKRAAAEAARGLAAEERTTQAEKLNGILTGAAALYAKGDQAGYTAWLQQNQVDPAQYPFEMFPAHAATVKGAMDALKEFAPEAPKPADDYQRYVQEEMAAGRQPLDRIGFSQALKGKGFEVQLPDGTRVSQGGAQGSGNMVGDAYNPGEIDSALGMIDSIIGNPEKNIPEDPNLSRVVGPVVGGGGNNIDDLGVAQRMYYGGEGTALVEKIGQLQNVAWLSARAMLKGGGAITDYESRKAEGAVARLSRAKDPDAFRAAAKELRDAIAAGKAKLDAARNGGATPPPASPPPSNVSDEDLMNQLLGGN